MNEATLQELKMVVERAMRPVRATLARKRRMREELLAHLVAIFGEEAGRLGDERAALEQAKQRFGDPGELTAQLQQAVPRWNRWRSVLENLGYRPSEAAWHLAARHFLVMLLIYALWLPIWEGFKFNWRIPGPAEAQRLVAFILVGAVILAALWNVVLSILLAPLLNNIGPVLASKRGGRIALAVLCGCVVLGGFVTPAFAGAAVLFFLMARQAVNERRYRDEWARLDVAE